MTDAQNLEVLDAETLPVQLIDQPPTPMTLISRALEQGASVETLDKLMGLYERWEATQARRAYVQAINAFKQDPPEVHKDKHVTYDTTKGTTEYYHSSLDLVVAILTPALIKHGISHKWEVDQSDGVIKVTCVLTHEQGHSERVSMQSAPDASGGKNSIQAIGSASTYLQRYTLLAATGLTPSGEDNDGADLDYISEDEVKELLRLAEDVGANKQKFCEYLGVASFPEILNRDAKKARDALLAKRKSKGLKDEGDS